MTPTITAVFCAAFLVLGVVIGEIVGIEVVSFDGFDCHPSRGDDK